MNNDWARNTPSALSRNEGASIFFAVVGASGAGKDTLIDHARRTLEDDGRFEFPRRYITRDADAGGENHIPLTPWRFRKLKADCAFLLDWRAHGHSYGLPSTIPAILSAGTSVIVNLSRAAVEPLMKKIEHVHVVHITASADVIARRLAGRGRESAADIEHRLTRPGHAFPEAVRITTIRNDGTVEEAGEELVACLRRLSAHP